MRCNPANVPLDSLRQNIWEAWEAVLESYIVVLLDGWRDWRPAVIDAIGGPTKYWTDLIDSIDYIPLFGAGREPDPPWFYPPPPMYRLFPGAGGGL